MWSGYGPAAEKRGLSYQILKLEEIRLTMIPLLSKSVTVTYFYLKVWDMLEDVLVGMLPGTSCHHRMLCYRGVTMPTQTSRPGVGHAGGCPSRDALGNLCHDHMSCHWSVSSLSTQLPNGKYTLRQWSRPSVIQVDPHCVHFFDSADQ